MTQLIEKVNKESTLKENTLEEKENEWGNQPYSRLNY